MNVAIDVDGTIDSFPRIFQSLMSALTAAGHHVMVLTGVSSPQVTDDDIAAKRGYLLSLGISSDCYSELIVCPSPHPKNKAAAIVAGDVDLVIDNKQKTAKKASSAAAVLILWNSIEP